MQSQTTSPLMRVDDDELAARLNMQAGKFYAYYKPGYSNGFGTFQGQDIDFCYLQACESMCRDEFAPDEEVILKEQYNKLLEQNGGVHTASFVK